MIWEAWTIIKGSHFAADTLDSESLTEAIIAGMLNSTEKPIYPFLTQLDSVRRLPKSVPNELKDVGRAWELHRRKWPDTNAQFLSETAIRSLMAGLGDPVSTYLTPESYDQTQRAQLNVSGKYEGIGTVLERKDQRVAILAVISGSPAEKAGLLSGDMISAINGKSVEGQSLDESVGNIKGTSGTRLTFVIQRPGESGSREISVTRAAIELPSVDMTVLPGSVGYLRIDYFWENTIDSVLDALEGFNQLETLALILDLRGNTGIPLGQSSLDIARTVASQFLQQGLFMYELDGKDRRTDWPIEEGGIAAETMLMVVLTNNVTAYAAEVLAGSLQDAKRASVIGVRTRGMGSTNVYKEISDGAFIYFPVTRWYTPSGRKIISEGIQPDITVEITSDDRLLGKDTQMLRAYEYLNNLLPAFR